MPRWAALLSAIPLAIAQTTNIDVYPNDYRLVYGWGTGSVGNFQQYNATYGGIIVTECTGVMRLFGPGNSAKLAFRGTAVEFSVLLDSTAGRASIRLGGDILEDFNGAYNSSVAQGQCYFEHVNRTGLADQVWIATVVAEDAAPVFLKRISFQPSPSLVTTAPSVSSGDLQVLMNSSEVTYRNNGQPIALEEYATGYGNNNSGFWESMLCGSYVDLWSGGSSATLLFNGTSATVNLLRNQYGGAVDIYLDGTLVKSANSYGTQFIGTSCDIAPVTFSNLAPHDHNLTAVNPTGGSNGWVLIQSIVYTPTGAARATKTSKRPIIGGVVGGVLGVLLLILAFIFYRRRRKATNRRNRTILIDEEPRSVSGLEMNPILQDGHSHNPASDVPTSTTGIVQPENKNLLPHTPPSPTDAPPEYEFKEGEARRRS